jgi:GntR family transcriptional regulator
MIEFHLDAHSGVPPYLQIVQQVKQAMRLGLLEIGDQLPTVRGVVAQLAINPNTVLKAYRDLERESLVISRPGQGTFVQRTLASVAPARHAALRRSLTRWLRSAAEAGLDSESVLALFMSTFHESQTSQTSQTEETA